SNAQMRGVFAQQLDGLGAQIKGELGVNPLDLAGYVHGRVAFAVSGTVKPDPDADQPSGLSIALLADTGADKEAAEKILSALTAKLREQKDAVAKTVTVGSTDVS